MGSDKLFSKKASASSDVSISLVLTRILRELIKSSQEPLGFVFTEGDICATGIALDFVKSFRRGSTSSPESAMMSYFIGGQENKVMLTIRRLHQAGDANSC